VQTKWRVAAFVLGEWISSAIRRTSATTYNKEYILSH